MTYKRTIARFQTLENIFPMREKCGYASGMENKSVDIDFSKPPHWPDHGIEYVEFHGVSNLPEGAGHKVVLDLRDVDELDAQEVDALSGLGARAEKLVLLHAGGHVRKLFGNTDLLLAASCDEALGLFDER